MNPGDSNSLCLECGLCCNGVIFANGQLQPEDDARHLRVLGLKFTSSQTALRESAFLHNGKPSAAGLGNPSKIENRKFLQPCACFDGCHCKIYSDRPKYCREFECLLLKSVNAGRTESAAALRIIRDARRRADKIKRLLRDLGNSEEDVALSKRFRKVKRQLESHPLDENAAETFSDLSLAVHDLNLLLSEAFYPAP